MSFHEFFQVEFIYFRFPWMYFILKSCQIVAGIWTLRHFHEFLRFNFWRVFCYLAQLCRLSVDSAKGSNAGSETQNFSWWPDAKGGVQDFTFELQVVLLYIYTANIPSVYYYLGWQTSRGHKGRIFVDKKGEFSWTLLVTWRQRRCTRFHFWAASRLLQYLFSFTANIPSVYYYLHCCCV